MLQDHLLIAIFFKWDVLLNIARFLLTSTSRSSAIAELLVNFGGLIHEAVSRGPSALADISLLVKLNQIL